MNERLIYEFLLESTISGLRQKNQTKNAEEIIKLVVRRAHKDVMIGARYKTIESSISYCEYNWYYQNLVCELILAKPTQVSGRKTIEYICDKRKKAFAVNIGLIQKLVNMTVKYLYVIKGCGIDLGFHIIENESDCPLDSRILGRLSKDTRKKYKGWTTLDDLDEYKDIQGDIQWVIKGDTKKYVGESRLEYDLVNWGLSI